MPLALFDGFANPPNILDYKSLIRHKDLHDLNRDELLDIVYECTLRYLQSNRLVTLEQEIMSQSTLNIPSSDSTVNVHIIDSTAHISGIPAGFFMEPAIKGYDIVDAPAYSFLVEHPKDGRKVVFDLGVRKDWENLPPSIVKRAKEGNYSITIERSVAEILEAGGVKPIDIEAIIWRFILKAC